MGWNLELFGKMKDTMLEITGLHKSYDSREALRGIDIRLPPGDIYGLLGPNGAGKTTTLKILAGLLKPDRGTIRYNGHEYSRTDTEMRRRIAYVPDQPYLYPKLTGEEHLHFYADLYAYPREKRRDRFDFYFRFFEFESYRYELVENYSAGTRQKLLITQALSVEPQLILLDEPMVSIDPLVGRKFKTHLRQLADCGVIILFATHILSLAREICKRIGIIVDGRLVSEGDLESLLKAADGDLEAFYFQTVTNNEHIAGIANPATQE